MTLNPNAEGEQELSLSVGDALRILELCSNSVFSVWKFIITITTGIFGGVVFQFQQIGGLDVGIKAILCLIAWLVFLALVVGMGRNKKRLHAAFELLRLVTRHSAEPERQLVERLTSRVIVSEYFILVFAVAFSVMVFWSELRQAWIG